MKRLFALTALLFLAAPAVAQQQQPTTPAETAIQINNVIGTWSQTLMQQGKVIDELQKQLATANARIKELEPKISEQSKPNSN
jgi:septal ring factor EnvC (AmiA/AmiB activator)